MWKRLCLLVLVVAFIPRALSKGGTASDKTEENDLSHFCVKHADEKDEMKERAARLRVTKRENVLLVYKDSVEDSIKFAVWPTFKDPEMSRFCKKIDQEIQSLHQKEMRARQNNETYRGPKKTDIFCDYRPDNFPASPSEKEQIWALLLAHGSNEPALKKATGLLEKRPTWPDSLYFWDVIGMNFKNLTRQEVLEIARVEVDHCISAPPDQPHSMSFRVFLPRNYVRRTVEKIEDPGILVDKVGEVRENINKLQMSYLGQEFDMTRACRDGICWERLMHKSNCSTSVSHGCRPVVVAGDGVHTERVKTSEDFLPRKMSHLPLYLCKKIIKNIDKEHSGFESCLVPAIDDFLAHKANENDWSLPSILMAVIGTLSTAGGVHFVYKLISAVYIAVKKATGRKTPVHKAQHDIEPAFRLEKAPVTGVAGSSETAPPPPSVAEKAPLIGVRAAPGIAPPPAAAPRAIFFQEEDAL